MEGYMAGLVSAESGHVVGVDSKGQIFRSRFGEFWTTLGVWEVMELVIRKVGRLWQMWFILLPIEDVVGTRPRVMGAEGFPSWHWRVGEQRLWRVICTVLADWRYRRTPVRCSVDAA